MTFEINRHERAAIRTNLAGTELKDGMDDGSVEMVIEQAFRAALQDLMYQGFITQVFEDALKDRIYEDPPQAHICAKLPS